MNGRCNVADVPAVPLTIEGSFVLHQMFRLHRSAWRAQERLHQEHLLETAIRVLTQMEASSKEGHPNQSALYSMVGHKGDFMFLHFRDTLEDLHRAELTFAQTAFADFLEPIHSYVSVVELGLYESSAKTYAQLAENGLEPYSAEWNAGVAEVIARQTAAMDPRLYPGIPAGKYLCFYPMDRRRGEFKNWYQTPMADRQRLMHEHGMVGRRYAGQVKQIITGSIGFDDWEWGVDLFADDLR
jgi:hydrogen peroxide-dependent heme synthase